MKDLSSKHLFIFAGEPSGDLHGSRLIRLLKTRSDSLSITGVAGPQMRCEGITGPLKMEDFEVMGFTDVIRSLPSLYNHFYTVRNTILQKNPDAVVLIDYPGFNLRLAKALRKKGFKGNVIQYISPSVWAWGKHRIGEMEKNLDMLLTIYPFEAAHFSKSSLDVNYVGSPLQEYIREYSYRNDWKQKLSIPESKKIIAIFPGSRKAEIARNLPVILEAAILLKKNDPNVIFGISCFNDETGAFLESLLDQFQALKKAVYQIPKEYSYELMRDSCCAIAKSGTVTLELALHHCPTVVVYTLTTLNRLYAKYILKVNLPHYCIVNILAGQEVFPEYIVNEPDAQSIFHQLKSLVADSPERDRCIRQCKAVDKSLGTHNASSKASDAILRRLQC